MSYRITKRGLYAVALVHMLTVFLLAGFAGAIENNTGPTFTQLAIVSAFLALSYAGHKLVDGSKK